MSWLSLERQKRELGMQKKRMWPSFRLNSVSIERLLLGRLVVQMSNPSSYWDRFYSQSQAVVFGFHNTYTREASPRARTRTVMFLMVSASGICDALASYRSPRIPCPDKATAWWVDQPNASRVSLASSLGIVRMTSTSWTWRSQHAWCVPMRYWWLDYRTVVAMPTKEEP